MKRILLCSCIWMALVNYGPLSPHAKSNIEKTLQQIAQQEDAHYKDKAERLECDKTKLLSLKDILQHTVESQENKINHLIKFSEFREKSLEDRNNELFSIAQEKDAILQEKNNHISGLLSEVQTVRKAFGESLQLRSNLQQAYSSLEKTLKTAQKNHEKHINMLNKKLIDEQTHHQASLTNESRALHHVALLSKALKDNEEFYSKEVNKVFDELAYELEHTKDQLSLSTEAYYEAEEELALLKEQLFATQQLLARGGLANASEKDLKEFKKTLSKLSTKTAETQATYHGQLSHALTQIKELDRKLSRAQQEINSMDELLATQTTRAQASQADAQQLRAELSRSKEEYNNALSQDHVHFAKLTQRLEKDLEASKNQLASAERSIQGKDLAFKILEKSLKNQQELLEQERRTQKDLIAQLSQKESLVASLQNKLKGYENSALNKSFKQAQNDLAKEKAASHELRMQLQEVSAKLASTSIEHEKLSKEIVSHRAASADYRNLLFSKDVQIAQLQQDKTNHLIAQNEFNAALEKAHAEKHILTSKLEKVSKFVAQAKQRSLEHKAHATEENILDQNYLSASRA